jgi:hypothetical protein
MSHPEQTPQQWFDDAVRWYDDRHQGCPWCGGANSVYRTERNGVIEFYCGNCQFFAGHDARSDRFFAGPGRDRPAPSTMFAI